MFLLEVVRAPNVVDQPPSVIERLATLVTKHLQEDNKKKVLQNSSTLLMRKNTTYCSLSARIVMFSVVYVQLELEGETLPALIAQNIVGNDVVVALEVKRHSFGLLKEVPRKIYSSSTRDSWTALFALIRVKETG